MYCLTQKRVEYIKDTMGVVHEWLIASKVLLRS